MPTYYVNEAAFTLPERGFVDRTLHRLESPLSGQDSLSIEVRRLPMQAGKSLRQLVDEEIASSEKTVNGYTLVDASEVAIGGSPAIVVRARLRALDTVHGQLQAHVALGETWITLVVRGPSSQRKECDEAFDRMVQTIAWRTD